MLLLLLFACVPSDPPAARSPGPRPAVTAPRPAGPALRVDGAPVPLPGLCETSGAARDASGAIWLVDDDQRDALFAWTPGAAPQRQPVEGRPWKDAEGLALDGQGGLWLAGGHGRGASSGKVGKRATVAHFVDGPGWTLDFATDALRPGRDREELAPLLDAVRGHCPACAFGDGVFGAEDGRALDLEAAAWHDGGLLLGLRAPLASDRAVAFSVNAAALREGAPLPAVVRGAWSLDLGGRGIRDLSPAPDGSLLLLAGGPSGTETPGGALYQWRPGGAATLLGTLPPLSGPAEALVADGADAAWLFLDEGRRLARGLRPGGPHADAEGELSCGANGASDWAHAVRITW